MKLGPAIFRLVRGTVAILVSGLVVTTTNNPKMILLAPVINAAAKYLRQKTGWLWIPV